MQGITAGAATRSTDHSIHYSGFLAGPWRNSENRKPVNSMARIHVWLTRDLCHSFQSRVWLRIYDYDYDLILGKEMPVNPTQYIGQKIT